MKVKTQYEYSHKVPYEFEKFCLENGITISVKTRPKKYGLPRWYASSDNLVEVVGNGVLTSVRGDGDTREEAIDNYVKALAGQIVRFLLNGSEKRVQTPRVWGDKEDEWED